MELSPVTGIGYEILEVPISNTDENKNKLTIKKMEQDHTNE